MNNQKKSQIEYLVEKLDRELMARGAQIVSDNLFNFKDRDGTPQRKDLIEGVQQYYGSTAPPSPDDALEHIKTPDLIKMLEVKAQELNIDRGISGEESRRDYFEIGDEGIREKSSSVAAICMRDSLIEMEDESFTLKVKNYGKVFNLCQSEPFYHQDIAAGRLCTGFLVKEDVIATAGHCVCEQNIDELRFIFGYKKADTNSPGTQIHRKNIYRGVRIIDRALKRKGNKSDWALVQLDRKVKGHEVVTLSRKTIALKKDIYIIGHPVGLPLKYSPGATVRSIDEAYFSADLNVYSGNSGSPVFDKDTHEVIGIVVRTDIRDFRLVENCWRSVIYSRTDRNSPEPQCTKVSEFIDIVDRL